MIFLFHTFTLQSPKYSDLTCVAVYLPRKKNFVKRDFEKVVRNGNSERIEKIKKKDNRK
jgi:hypothetical protein